MILCLFIYKWTLYEQTIKMIQLKPPYVTKKIEAVLRKIQELIFDHMK